MKIAQLAVGAWPSKALSAAARIGVADVIGDEPRPYTAHLLPLGVRAAEAFDDAIAAPLFPTEAALVANSVPKRAQEFDTTRRCARLAPAELGEPAVPIISGLRGAPVWPRAWSGA